MRQMKPLKPEMVQRLCMGKELLLFLTVQDLGGVPVNLSANKFRAKKKKCNAS